MPLYRYEIDELPKLLAGRQIRSIELETTEGKLRALTLHLDNQAHVTLAATSYQAIEVTER